MENFNLEVHSTLNRTGKRTLFYPTINGKRINKTNYARKYDAKNLIKSVFKNHSIEKITEYFV